MRTRVGIVGAGPAGLLLSHLLARTGIESVVLEARSRARVEERIRAGILEHGTAALLRETGLGDRMDRIGSTHDGTLLRFGGALHRIDFRALTGKSVTLYSQHEVVRDLIAARLAAGGTILFEAECIGLDGLDGDAPRIRYRMGGEEHALDCDVVAGCDGFHGVCRQAIPDGVLTEYERVYPFGWLGILAEVPPVADELIYANDPRGFALASMRSPEISRHYLQCAPDEDLSRWPDERIWGELAARLGDGVAVTPGPILQKSVTAMRSFVVEPMRYGHLFLLGDAAHIVPPTGAKGLNLAVADVVVLAGALRRFYASGDASGLDGYSATCLARIWQVQRFSWWMTSMLHRFDTHGAFERRVQRAELEGVAASRAGATWLAENYVGLPFAEA